MPRLKRIRMYKLLLLVIFVVLLPAFSVQAETEHAATRMMELCREFNSLNTAIRDRGINKNRAKEQLEKLIGQIRGEYYASGGSDHSTTEWVFPLQGYGYRATCGTNGSCYQPRGYDYFDGNRHGGHPSLDI